jgi:hypothetical protein
VGVGASVEVGTGVSVGVSVGEGFGVGVEAGDISVPLSQPNPDTSIVLRSNTMAILAWFITCLQLSWTILSRMSCWRIILYSPMSVNAVGNNRGATHLGCLQLTTKQYKVCAWQLQSGEYAFYS